MKRIYSVILLCCLPLLGEDTRTNKVYQTWYDTVLPQVADGGGWSTRIWLVNMGDTAAKFALYFYRSDGSGWNIMLKETTQASAVWRAEIPVGGSMFLETMGTDAQTSQGWAYLETSSWISGSASFKADWVDPATTKPVYAEGVVPFTPENDFDSFVVFDNRNGYVTAAAIVNPYLQETASVTIQLRSPDGTVIKSDSFQLGPLQQMTIDTTKRYPETVGKNGIIEFTETGGRAAVSALGLLFSPRSTFTSIHPVSIDCHYYNSAACPTR